MNKAVAIERSAGIRVSLPVTVTAGQLFATLLVLMAADNLLLLRFLGMSWALVAPLLAAGCGGVALLVSRDAGAAWQTVSWPLLGGCLLVATLLLVLGGEGRLFYANTDWQVRDALLADMARHPWPIAYLLNGGLVLLRAPIGMYLAPALLGETGQAGLDAALLVCNALVLGLMLALGATLFEGLRARLIALAVFVLFSGWDAVGTAVVAALGAHPSFDHLERWAWALQYSSHVTMIFWVPHHAFAGWLCALGYLLWRQRRIGIGAFMATVPLVALWSPLAIMGAVPFAALAGVTALRERSLRARDFSLPLLALLIALPALVYLRADALSVPSGPNPVPSALYAFSMLIEVAPFALPLVLMRRNGLRFGGDTLGVVLLCLLLIPLWRIGWGTDFQMRASIMPLAILALMTADLLIDGAVPRAVRLWLCFALAIGALTGAAELRRGLVTRASPPPRCSLIGVWRRQTDVQGPYGTYLASPAALPALLRPATVTPLNRAPEPIDCWGRPWRVAAE